MNILKTIRQLISGPLLVPTTFGDAFLLVAAIVYFSLNPATNIIFITLAATALYPFLFYYIIATQTLVTNGIFEEAPEKIKDMVERAANDENAHVNEVKIVSNFAQPTIICGRFAQNMECFISKHYLEESNQHLISFLVQDAAANLKKVHLTFLLNTTFFAALTVMNLLSMKIAFSLNLSIIKLILFLFVTTRACALTVQFLKATTLRAIIFKQDANLAKKMGKEALINNLQGFNALSNFDNNFYAIPEWGMGIPKVTSRIDHLRKN